MADDEKKMFPDERENAKPGWQMKKEEMYDRLNVSVKQVDIFIGIMIGVLVLVFILIGLEAAGIFSLFPNR